MTDETSDSEDKVENQPNTQTATVKKKTVAKKRVVRKKTVAKKGAATKKKTTIKKAAADKSTGTGEAATVSSVARASPPDAPRKEVKPAEPEEEAKAEKPTMVAVASAAMPSASQPTETKLAPTTEKTSSLNVIIQAQIENDNPPEEPSMSSDSKSSGSFRLKAIFWLIIIILGFMYIRSLAKNPPTESAASATDVQQEEMAASSDSGSEEGGYGNEAAMSTSETGGGSESIFRERTTSQEDQAGAVTDPEDSLGLVSGSSVSQERQIIQAAPRESAGTAERVLPKTSVASTENKTMESATAQEQAPPAQDYHGGSLTGSTAEAQEDRAPQTGRELHAESVSKILKEFDDLRDAAKAEMEAMRNLMQAERELQEAMASPPPPVYQHRWRGPAYHPHSAYPPAGGYSPYDNRP